MGWVGGGRRILPVLWPAALHPPLSNPNPAGPTSSKHPTRLFTAHAFPAPSRKERPRWAEPGRAILTLPPFLASAEVAVMTLRAGLDREGHPFSFVSHQLRGSALPFQKPRVESRYA